LIAFTHGLLKLAIVVKPTASPTPTRRARRSNSIRMIVDQGLGVGVGEGVGQVPGVDVATS
jgi:hypothetical protein